MNPYGQGAAYPILTPEVGDIYPGLVGPPSPILVPRYVHPTPGPLTGEMIYPGHGMPPRAGENRPSLSAWGRLARGQPLGKKVVVVYNADRVDQSQSKLTILNLAGDDMDACPVMVTLAPPQIIAKVFSSALYRINTQNLTGEQSNIQQDSVFPGTASPPIWPPLEAIVEWGIGGGSAQMVVDFVNGTTIPNLTASWVRVHIVESSGSGDQPVTGTSAAYVLHAWVGPGPGWGTPQRTVWIGPVASLAESDVTAVPKFARRVTVVGADGTSPPQVTVATLRFWQDRARTACVGNYVISGNQPASFEIPNAAMYASVINGMGVESKLGIVYQLLAS